MSARTETPGRETVEWDRNRQRALRRDQYRCQHCDRRDGPYTDLHVHHIQPVEHGGGHQLENLVVLCSLCHNNIHSRAGDDCERVELELLEEERAGFGFPDYRIELSSMREVDQQIVSILRENGPTKISELAAQTDYTRNYVQSRIQFLKTANYTCRMSRGVYAYIPTIAYRRTLKGDADEYGRRHVSVWNPGEQAKLSEFKDREEADGD